MGRGRSHYPCGTGREDSSAGPAIGSRCISRLRPPGTFAVRECDGTEGGAFPRDRATAIYAEAVDAGKNISFETDAWTCRNRHTRVGAGTATQVRAELTAGGADRSAVKRGNLLGVCFDCLGRWLTEGENRAARMREHAVNGAIAGQVLEGRTRRGSQYDDAGIAFRGGGQDLDRRVSVDHNCFYSPGNPRRRQLVPSVPVHAPRCFQFRAAGPAFPASSTGGRTCSMTSLAL